MGNGVNLFYVYVVTHPWLRLYVGIANLGLVKEAPSMSWDGISATQIELLLTRLSVYHLRVLVITKYKDKGYQHLK